MTQPLRGTTRKPGVVFVGATTGPNSRFAEDQRPVSQSDPLSRRSEHLDVGHVLWDMALGRAPGGRFQGHDRPGVIPRSRATWWTGGASGCDRDPSPYTVDDDGAWLQAFLKNSNMILVTLTLTGKGTHPRRAIRDDPWQWVKTR